MFEGIISLEVDMLVATRLKEIEWRILLYLFFILKFGITYFQIELQDLISNDLK